MVRIVLLRLLESYFRHRWLYLLPLVIALGAGAAFIATAEPEYIAVGRLYVEKETLLGDLTSTSSDASWWLTASQLTSTELSELLGTRVFLRSAIKGVPSLQENLAAEAKPTEERTTDEKVLIEETYYYFAQALTIQPGGDKLVEIMATSDDPAIAQQMVASTMDAYIDWKMAADYEESQTASSYFAGLIKPYQDTVDAARAELLAYLDDHELPVRGERPPQEQLEIDRLQQAVSRAEDRLNAALDNEESARLADEKSASLTRQTYQVLDPPDLPAVTELTVKSVLTDMILFIAVGIFLVVAGIGGGALIDRTLRFPIDVRHGLSLPVLAMLSPDKGTKREPIAAPAPAPTTSPTEEAAASETNAASDPSVLQPQI